MDIIDQSAFDNDDTTSLKEILEKGYSFDFGGWISGAWDILQRHMGWFVLHSLIFIAISMILSLIPIPVVNTLPAGIVALGFATYAAASYSQNGAAFDNFWDPWKDFVQLILVTLIVTLLSSIVIVPYVIVFPELIDLFTAGNDQFAANQATRELGSAIESRLGAFIALSLVVAIVTVIIGTIYMLAPHFVIFGRLGFWDAMEASRKVVSKRFFMSFLFLFVTALIAGLGILACGVGILLTLPIYYLAIFTFYRSVVGLQPVEID